MKTTVFAAALLLVVAACDTGGVGRQSYTDTDSGTHILLDGLEEFEIQLESNPSTGYGWVIAPDSMPGIITLTDDGYLDPDSDLVGTAGTQWFQFEASESEGAGVLRLEYVRPFDDPVVPERVVEYIVRVEGAAWPPSTVTPPSTSTATAPATVGPPSTIAVDTVASVLAGEPRTVTVAGFLLSDDSGTRLCEALAESFPPQCGMASIEVVGAALLDVEWSQAQGVLWTDEAVTVTAEFDGQRLIVPDA